MLPGDAEEPQSHQKIFSNDDSCDGNVDESRVAHCYCETHHECFIRDGIDQRSQSTSLVEVTRDIPVCEVENARKGKR